MTVEILFGEICNYFGDPRNETYLRQTLEGTDSRFISTGLYSEPFFMNGRPDLILMGSMSERSQRMVIERLTPFRRRMEELIDSGTAFLVTGNACEVFCSSIEYRTDGVTVPGLGLFDLTVENDMFRRINGKVIGDFDGITVTGFRSQFTEIRGDNSGGYFLDVERGFGLNASSRLEGMRRNNFIGTQLLGPILPLNPDFCRYLLQLAGTDAVPAFYEAAREAYDRRVAEFRDPETKF